MNAACALQPKSIIELGIGCGKYGSLLREYLDWAHGRFNPENNEIQIIGVEGFEGYCTPNWDNYDAVFSEDFTKEVEGYKDFDLVLMVDSLEHVEYEKGKELLLGLKKYNRHLLISTPAPNYYAAQGAVFGNELEIHRHRWLPSEFVSLMGGKLLYSNVCQLFYFIGDLK